VANALDIELTEYDIQRVHRLGRKKNQLMLNLALLLQDLFRIKKGMNSCMQKKEFKEKQKTKRGIHY